MSVQSWDQLITRVKTDENLTEKYYNHYHRFSEAFLKRNNNSIQQKRDIILNQRVVNPIYGLIRDQNSSKQIIETID